MSVDLIYLDPPFNSKANYNQLFHTDGGGDAQYRAFSDTWVWDGAAEERLQKYLNATALQAHYAISGLYMILRPCGMLAYLTYMAERLEHCRRLLKGFFHFFGGFTDSDSLLDINPVHRDGSKLHLQTALDFGILVHEL